MTLTINIQMLLNEGRLPLAEFPSGHPRCEADHKEDVAGLLENRLKKAKEQLDDALEKIRALCEPVEVPRDQAAYLRYFSSKESGNAEQLKANEPQRLTLYKFTAALIRAYANLADEMAEAGYTQAEADTVKKEVAFYENLRNEVKLHSGDAIDLKQYEPAMRHLIDTYIRAEPSETVSQFDDFSLIQLIVERGIDAVKALPKGIQQSKDAVAETIENNVRKLIVDESPINPKYYERMSELLDALIKERRAGALAYADYLAKIVELTKKVKAGPGGSSYPKSVNTAARRALFDNLGKNEALALAVDAAVLHNRQDEWRSNPLKVKKVRNAVTDALKQAGGQPAPENVQRVMDLVTNQHDY